jgi:hypothetical protein
MWKSETGDSDFERDSNGKVDVAKWIDGAAKLINKDNAEEEELEESESEQKELVRA